MSSVVEYLLSILESSVHLVEWVATFPYVMLRDKNDVCFGQIMEERSFADLTRINHAAVEPRSTWSCPLVAALYLHIVNGLAIGRKCVEPYGTSIEIWHTLLGNDLRHAQTIISHDGTEYDLHAGDIPIKAAIKERVIHQPKLFDFLKVLTFLLFHIHAHYLGSNDLSNSPNPAAAPPLRAGRYDGCRSAADLC